MSDFEKANLFYTPVTRFQVKITGKKSKRLFTGID